MAAANQAEIDFGLERQGECQAALRYLLGNGANEPYRGTFAVEGSVPLVVDDPDYIAAWYSQALKDFCVHEGAAVGLWVEGEDGFCHELATDGELVRAAPTETVMITARIPPKLVAARRQVECQAIEACAEAMRVVLAASISAAVADKRKDERVRAMFRLEPKIVHQFNVSTGIGAVGGEFRVNIFTEFEPRVSYILGAAVGGPPMKLLYVLPLVELYHGENRLRWMDSRAPDAQRKVQVVGGAR